jgi:hypothetical protein
VFLVARRRKAQRTRESEQGGQDSSAWPSGSIRFKTALRIKDVLARLEAER